MRFDSKRVESKRTQSKRIWGRLIWVMIGETLHLELQGRSLDVGESVYVLDRSEGIPVGVEVSERLTRGYHVEYAARASTAPAQTTLLREGCLCARSA